MQNKNVDNGSETGLWNALLGNVLTAIHQHFLHARILKHYDHMELADYEYKMSIENMRHADLLIEYILAAGNIPNPQVIDCFSPQIAPFAIVKADSDHASAMQRTVHLLIQTQTDANAIALLTVIEKSLEERVQYMAQWCLRNAMLAVPPDERAKVGSLPY